MTEKPSANHTALHKQCVNEIRKALGRESDFTLWENSKVQIVKGAPRAMPGLTKGASDMLGILAPCGRLFTIEMKTGSARPTEEQTMFIELIRKRGGFACIVQADSVEEAVEKARAALTRARLGMTE